MFPFTFDEAIAPPWVSTRIPSVSSRFFFSVHLILSLDRSCHHPRMTGVEEKYYADHEDAFEMKKTLLTTEEAAAKAKKNEPGRRTVVRAEAPQQPSEQPAH